MSESESKTMDKERVKSTVKYAITSRSERTAIKELPDDN
jgi:hypothetical protein